MKIRNGFVSNSSSSSFILIVKKDVHMKILEGFDEVEKGVISELSSRKDVYGVPSVVFYELYANDFSSLFGDFYIQNDDDDKYDVRDIFDRYEKLVKQISSSDFVRCEI